MIYEAIKELIEAEKFPDALRMLDPVLERDPDDVIALFLYGQVLLQSEKPALAYHVFKTVTQMEPGKAQGWVNLGKCMDDLHRQEEAQKCYRKALKIEPNNPQATVNMSSSAVQQCNYEKAIHWAKKAQLVSPDALGPHINLGFALLLKGDYARGWHEYEFGLGNMKWRDERIYGDEPRWDGSHGKTVICYGEQGIGDQIALAGCVNDAKQDCTVILDVAPKLKGLFARSFGVETHGDQFSTDLDWPYDRKDRIDARCALSSLQKYYRNSLDKFTGEPYLVADPVRRKAWKAILGDLSDKPKVGIAWSGGMTETQAEARTATLDMLRQILAQDVTWIDLEYKDRSAEIAASGVEIHSFPWATQTDDYDDTAALVAELDMVISVPTSVVHLAGGLGIPCLCLLHPKSHFIFGLGDTMPWYSSVRLFRRTGSDWTEQVNKVAEHLRKWHEARRIDSSRSGTQRPVQASG